MHMPTVATIFIVTNTSQTPGLCRQFFNLLVTQRSMLRNYDLTIEKL